MVDTFLSTDLGFYFTAGGGSGDLRTSNLGGDISATQITSSTMRNFIPDLLRSQIGNIGSPSGDWAIYIPYHIKNKNATVSITNVYQWVYKPPSNPTISVSLGRDPAGLNEFTQVIPNQLTAPDGVTFSTSIKSTPDNNMLVPYLVAGDTYPCWIRISGKKGIRSIPMVTFGIKVKWDPDVIQAIS